MISEIDKKNFPCSGYYQYLPGSRRISNFFWAGTLLIAGLGFILASLECYSKKNIISLFNTTSLNFIPQGIVMFFYGTIGLIIGSFIVFTIYHDLGGGNNYFDLEKKLIIIVRKGFPGKFQEIVVTYSFDLIQSLELVLDTNILARRNLFLCTKDNRKIPLFTEISFLTNKELEEAAEAISTLLIVPIERKIEF